MFKRTFLAITAFVGVLSVPGAALAAGVSAITTADLNIRVGPGANYARFATIPYGDNVSVNGCIAGYNWCDVSWAGTRGWVSGNYLAYLGERYYRRPIPTVAVAIGVPVIGYDYDNYFDRYYVGRHFHGYHFDRHRLHHRRVIRPDRRDHRRDIRNERREDRREIWQNRREHRQDIRQDRREHRQEIRRDWRERRQEIRQHRGHEARQGRHHQQRREIRQNRQERRHEARQERRQEPREMRRERRHRD